MTPGSKVLFIVTDHHTLWSVALSSYVWSQPQSLRLIQRELYTGAITLDFSDLVEKNSRHDIHEKHSLISKTIVWKYIFSTKLLRLLQKSKSQNKHLVRRNEIRGRESSWNVNIMRSPVLLDCLFKERKVCLALTLSSENYYSQLSKKLVQLVQYCAHF